MLNDGSYLLAVLTLAALVVLITVPRQHRHADSTHLPLPPFAGEEPPDPLPTDQRAHLAWVADNSEDVDLRTEAIARLRSDDRRRGRERGYRHRSP